MRVDYKHGLVFVDVDGVEYPVAPEDLYAAITGRDSGYYTKGYLVTPGADGRSVVVNFFHKARIVLDLSEYKEALRRLAEKSVRLSDADLEHFYNTVLRYFTARMTLTYTSELIVFKQPPIIYDDERQSIVNAIFADRNFRKFIMASRDLDNTLRFVGEGFCVHIEKPTPGYAIAYILPRRIRHDLLVYVLDESSPLLSNADGVTTLTLLHYSRSGDLKDSMENFVKEIDRARRRRAKEAVDKVHALSTSPR